MQEDIRTIWEEFSWSKYKVPYLAPSLNSPFNGSFIDLAYIFSLKGILLGRGIGDLRPRAHVGVYNAFCVINRQQTLIVVMQISLTIGHNLLCFWKLQLDFLLGGRWPTGSPRPYLSSLLLLTEWISRFKVYCLNLESRAWTRSLPWKAEIHLLFYLLDSFLIASFFFSMGQA